MLEYPYTGLCCRITRDDVQLNDMRSRRRDDGCNSYLQQFIVEFGGSLMWVTPSADYVSFSVGTAIRLHSLLFFSAILSNPSHKGRLFDGEG